MDTCIYIHLKNICKIKDQSINEVFLIWSNLESMSVKLFYSLFFFIFSTLFWHPAREGSNLDPFESKVKRLPALVIGKV